MSLPTGLLSVFARSKFWHQWESRDLSLNARTGQTGTWGRNGPAWFFSSDSLINNRGYNVPAFEWVDLDGDGVRETPVFVLGGQSGGTNQVASTSSFRDLTNAAWTKTGCTPAKTQTGIDGVANAASLLTDNGSGGSTCLSPILSGGTFSVVFSAFLRRVHGVGNIQMTQDGGASYTTVGPLTSAYQRFSIPTQSLSTPHTCGFKIVAAGDAIAVDWMQDDIAGFLERPTGSFGTNTGTDNGALSFPWLRSLTPFTAYTKFIERGACQDTSAIRMPLCIGDGTSTSYIAVQTNGVGTGYKIASGGATSATLAMPALGVIVELRLTYDGTTLTLFQSLNGAAETSVSLTCTITAINHPYIAIGGVSVLGGAGGNQCDGDFISLRTAPLPQSLLYMQTG